MKTESLLLLALVAGGAYLVLHKTTAQKRTWLVNYFASSPGVATTFAAMTDDEIKDAYSYVHDYVSATPRRDVPATDPLYPKIQAISVKYNIFT